LEGGYQISKRGEERDGKRWYLLATQGGKISWLAGGRSKKKPGGGEKNRTRKRFGSARQFDREWGGLTGQKGITVKIYC